jgi:ADP-ribose pyrophosphatase YjhB (NUDIX family)
VTLVPVGEGLLVGRRGIEPGRGPLALPDGYINLGETWQQACAREVLEETGVTIDPAQVREFAVRSAPESALLVFGLAAPLRPLGRAALPGSAKPLDCLILDEPVELAFTLHTVVVREYFQRQCAANVA